MAWEFYIYRLAERAKTLFYDIYRGMKNSLRPVLWHTECRQKNRLADLDMFGYCEENCDTRILYNKEVVECSKCKIL